MEELKPYLVQRANFLEREDKKGIDKILQFDYMGSAEFEFGALGESLGVIRNSTDGYEYNDISVKSKVITVFCRKSHLEGMYNYLMGLADRKFRLKEISDFDNYINPLPPHGMGRKNKTDFWWDLGNHIMFWKKDEKFEKRFKELIKV